MISFYIALAVVVLWGVRVNWRGCFCDSLNRESCNAVKGVFILLVFLCHITGYIKSSGYGFESVGDKVFLFVNSILGQLIVVMFLFYSGYGVGVQIKHSGQTYVNSIPKRRILSTMLNFDIAVVVFALVGLSLGLDIPISRFIKSLLAWESVGNSNWYIFMICICYAVTYFCYKIGRQCLLYVFISLTLVAIIFSFLKPSWWYNTILVYAMGLFWSEWKGRIDEFLDKRYWITLFTIGVIFVGLYLFPADICGLVYNLAAICFACWVVVITRKVKLRNKALLWAGANLFPLYIYQRLPMIAFKHLFGDEFVRTHVFVYVILCLMISVALSLAYRRFKITIS